MASCHYDRWPHCKGVIDNLLLMDIILAHGTRFEYLGTRVTEVWMTGDLRYIYVCARIFMYVCVYIYAYTYMYVDAYTPAVSAALWYCHS